MASGKIRIFELAKELGMTSKDLIALFERLGLEAKNQLAVVDDKIADLLRLQLKNRPAAPAAKPAAKAAAPAAPKAPAALRRRRRSAARRRSRRERRDGGTHASRPCARAAEA